MHLRKVVDGVSQQYKGRKAKWGTGYGREASQHKER